MNQNSNVTTLSINRIIKQLSEAYVAVINNDMPVTVLPSVMLWGSPGIGKSQGVKQLAEAIEMSTGKKVSVTDVRLLLFNPIDLRGIPTSNENKTLAVWLKPKIFHMDESTNVINILFLDEISAAPPSVQAAAYQITLDRVIGEHRLPENCIVIAAGNRVTDKSVAYTMPKALSNRLCHMEVKEDFGSWKEWAIKKGINEKVVGFLTFRQDYLMRFDTTKDDLAFATPRTWEMVSNILNFVSDDVNNSYSLIAGCVGIGVAVEFRTWCSVYDKLPNIEEIFEGKATKVPQSTDVMYAVISSMVSYAKKHSSDMRKIANSIAYAGKFPPDFATILLKDYMAIEDGYKQKLLTI